jgi:hypothetical protein
VKPDLEQQHDHAKLGEIVNYEIRGVENSENRFSQENSRHQLSHDGRLAKSLREETKQLRSDEQREEYSQKM